MLVTSSLKKKAEVEAGRPDDCVVHDSSVSILESGCAEPCKNRPLRPALAHEIAASAAKYVHTHAQEMASLGGAHWAEEGNGTPASGDGHVRPPERLRAPPRSAPAYSRVYNSRMAARVATSTMTSVVAAEEEAKVEAARNLRSPNSSPCEWFVCDDPSTFTRIFVIQVNMLLYCTQLLSSIRMIISFLSSIVFINPISNYICNPRALPAIRVWC